MNKLIQFRFLGANMTRPMGRIVAFAPEPGGFEGPVGEIARKIEDLGNDVWWIHRNGTDQPIDKVGQEKIDKIDRGAFDWRKLLNGARWLITSGPTLISSEDEQAVWSAALTFSELEGTLNALVLSSNDTSFIPIWTKIIPRIRQFHIIGLTSEEIRKISAHEEWSTPNNKRYMKGSSMSNKPRTRCVAPATNTALIITPTEASVMMGPRYRLRC